MSMLLMVKAMQTKVGNPIRKLVLLKLADNANDEGECWPSYGHLSDQCECSKSAVRRHIDELIKTGLLTKENRLGGEKGNKSNVYRLNLNTPMPSQSTPLCREKAEGMPPKNTGYATTEHPPMLSGGTRTYQLESVNEPVIEPIIAISSPHAKKMNRSHQLSDNLTATEKHRVLADGLNVDLRAEFEQFRDYHQARGSVFKNWDLAFNTWIRNAAKFSKNASGNGTQMTTAEHNKKILAGDW